MPKKETYIFLLIPILISLGALYYMNRGVKNDSCYKYNWLSDKVEYFPIHHAGKKFILPKKGGHIRSVYQKDTLIQNKNYSVFRNFTFQPELDNKIEKIENYYIRVDKKGVHLYDLAKNLENVMIDRKATVGDKWNFFGLELKLLSKEAILVTPSCVFTDLMKIGFVLNEKETSYYYDKKLGLVGIEEGGELVSYFSEYVR